MNCGSLTLRRHWATYGGMLQLNVTYVLTGYILMSSIFLLQCDSSVKMMCILLSNLKLYIYMLSVFVFCLTLIIFGGGSKISVK